MHFLSFKPKYFYWEICIRIFKILVYVLVLKYQTTAGNSKYYLALHISFVRLTKCTSRHPLCRSTLQQWWTEDTANFPTPRTITWIQGAPTRLHSEQVHLRGGAWTPRRLRALEASLSIKLLICSWIAHRPKRGWLTAVDSLVHHQPLCTEFASKYRSKGVGHKEESGPVAGSLIIRMLEINYTYTPLHMSITTQ